MEEKIGIMKRILKSGVIRQIITVILPLALGMLATLFSNDIIDSLFSSTRFFVFGILLVLVLVIITMVVTTVLIRKKGSPKDDILKDSLKKAYTDAIDRSYLNPAYKRSLEK
jgi:hypothetical protein